MLLRADFTSQNFFSDPVPTIEKLRAAGPVVEVRLPIFGRVWMTTTQEMACRMLKDNRVFTLRNEDGTVWMPGIFRASTKTMLSVDEPDHTRLRGIVEEAFRRRAVFDMEPRIRAIADEIASDLFSRGSPADLVERYARVLSLSVICELLGLPMADRPKFMAWTALATSASSPRDFVRMAPTLAAIKRYLKQRFDHARKFGGEGLVVELVGVEEEGAPITRDEMIVMVFVLLLAGHETTMHLISGSVFELTKNPQLRDWLEEDWSRADLAVEEFLRFVSPVQFSKPRFIRQDIELGDVRLKNGDQIIAMLAAGNMDAAANVVPEKLDLRRWPNRHIAFGTGIHFCLGHQLVRLEGKCALQALYQRWPKLRLAVEPGQIRWRSRPGIRAIIELPVAA
jgi:cytochrome P450